MSLKTHPKSKFVEYVDHAKKYFITEIKGFVPEKMVLCTLLFEGSAQEVALQQNSIAKLAKKYTGFRAGPENG